MEDTPSRETFTTPLNETLVVIYGRSAGWCGLGGSTSSSQNDNSLVTEGRTQIDLLNIFRSSSNTAVYLLAY